MIKINFSGHPVPGYELAPLVGVNVPVEDSTALTEALRKVLFSLPCIEELKQGAAAEVVLPGMATAAGVLLAVWHGVTGSFPTIRWAVKGPSGFAWPETARADLQDIRLQARTGR